MNLLFENWRQYLKEENGLDQVAGVGSDDENFYVKFSIIDLIVKAQNYPVQDIAIEELLPFLQGRIEDPEETQARADAASLQYPIIVVANETGKIFSILDGTHRVQKADSVGLEVIKGHIIPKGDMGEFAVRSENETPT